MSDCARQIKGEMRQRHSNEKFMNDKTVFVPFSIHDGKYEMICELWYRISHTGTHGAKKCWTKVKEENKNVEKWKIYEAPREVWKLSCELHHRAQMSPRAACRSATACVRRYLRRSTSEWFIDGGKTARNSLFSESFSSLSRAFAI